MSITFQDHVQYAILARAVLGRTLIQKNLIQTANLRDINWNVLILASWQFM